MGSGSSTIFSVTLPPIWAVGPPCIDISSVVELALRATKAQRDFILASPKLMLYSAQLPTTAFFRSTTRGKDCGDPVGWAAAAVGSRTKARAMKRFMESPFVGASLCPAARGVRDLWDGSRALSSAIAG